MIITVYAKCIINTPRMIYWEAICSVDRLAVEYYKSFCLAVFFIPYNHALQVALKFFCLDDRSVMNLM